MTCRSVPMLSMMVRGLILSLGLALPVLVGAITPARADLRLCNMTASRVGVTIGYRDTQDWTTEGWWTLKAKSCETLIRGPLSTRYFYVYAQDYDRGGEWAGQMPMCTRDQEFQIRGVEDCLARGFDRTLYFEVDTGEQKDWTVQLTDPINPGTQKR
jgi:uncharacterized membrane protein